MQIELDRLADFMGKLCGTARYDWVSADPGDVGLHGVPIKQWRDAYFEGCRDMAEGIASLVPVECRETLKQMRRLPSPRHLMKPRSQAKRSVLSWHDSPSNAQDRPESRLYRWIGDQSRLPSRYTAATN